MKSKFYNKFLSILKVKPLAFVCSRIFYFFSVLCYLFKSLLGRKCICESSAEGVRDINFCLSPAAAKDIDLSIIIPTYNSKEYLAECIFSVINEFTPPRHTYEIIVVDDGSTDGTEGFLEEKGLLGQIKYIRIENSGQGYARNRGVEASCGSRIMFIDADDILKNGVLDKALDYDEDLIQFGFEFFGDRQGAVLHKQIALCDQKKILKINCFFEGYPWGKIYKRELFSKWGFPEKIHFEDNNLSYLILPQVKTYRYIAEPLIGYRIHSKQETANVVKNGYGPDQVNVVCELCKAAKNICKNDNVLRFIGQITVANLTTVLQSRTRGDIDMLKKCFEMILYFDESRYFSDLKFKNFRGAKFAAAVKKRDFNKFKNVCRYL